jgi:hypothetical protein
VEIMDNIIIAYKIFGKDYYTVSQFSRLVNKTQNDIRVLICKGNSIRKLKAFRIENKVFIPASELVDFPFTSANLDVVYYNNEGYIDSERSKIK